MRLRLALCLTAAALGTTAMLALAQVAKTAATAAAAEPRSPEGKRYLSQPLVTSIYTADPSAHVFNGKIYVYPSHDIDADIPDDDLGSAICDARLSRAADGPYRRRR